MAQLDIARPRGHSGDGAGPTRPAVRPDPRWRSDTSYAVVVCVLAALLVALVAAMCLPV